MFGQVQRPGRRRPRGLELVDSPETSSCVATPRCGARCAALATANAPRGQGNPRSPQRLCPESLPDPPHRTPMTQGRGVEGLMTQLAPNLVARDERVGPLVHIGSNNNHGGCLLHCSVMEPLGRSADTSGWGRLPRSYQVTPAGPSHPAPAKRINANPKAATTLRARRQVFRIQPAASSGRLTLTLGRP